MVNLNWSIFGTPVNSQDELKLRIQETMQEICWKTHQQKPDKRLLRIRTYSTIWKCCTTDIHLTWKEVLGELALGNCEELYKHVASTLLDKRINNAPDWPIKKIAIATWNLNSLNDIYSNEANKKINVLKKLHATSITCLQETKWSDHQPVLLTEKIENS